VDDAKSKPCLAVVSPYLDKSHGTERRVVEWISRLTGNFEVHVYSQRVEDLDLHKIAWHRIPRLPGLHLLNYIWWFAANHAWRAWDRRWRRLRPDIVFSPGINCLDADAISVHIVFAEYARRVAGDLRLSMHPISLWPQLLHRKLYYRLIASLERRVYRNPRTVLILIAQKTARQLDQYFGRKKPSPVIYLGLDHDLFNPQHRASLRQQARAELGYSRDRFVLLLIGNHWTNKGLPVLLESLGLLRDIPVHVLAVGRENPAEYETLVHANGLEDRVKFKQPRADVELYYAAADAYAGPSLEDTFAMPPAEAMACGLPVIVSSANGTSEIITHGRDGLILNDPHDARSLAAMIRKLYEGESFRAQMAHNAAETARNYTWERNARELSAIFEDILRKKSQVAPESLVQES
jgi:glycosyltransferase involved in cell wall biosynthesis